MLANRRGVLPADIDQGAMVAQGEQFELATKGYFGDKRGRRGYQLSVAFINQSERVPLLAQGAVACQSQETAQWGERLGSFLETREWGESRSGVDVRRGEVEHGEGKARWAGIKVKARALLMPSIRDGQEQKAGPKKHKQLED